MILPDDATQYRYTDFTEDNYRALLTLAKTRYAFARFGDTPEKRHVLWRHDIDLSVHRALRLAQIEQEECVVSTYFVLLHSEFYNLFEASVAERIRSILQCGHSLGLHFDPSFYPNIFCREDLEEKLLWEKRLLEDLFDTSVDAFSYHNPDVGNALDYTDNTMAGMVNAYGEMLQKKYRYCSDSNGYWRFDRLYDVLTEAPVHNLQVLTHPGWWTPEPMSPRERISRCIDGRADACHTNYDQLLLKWNRSNIHDSRNTENAERR